LLITSSVLTERDNKADFILELLNNFSFVKAKPFSPAKDKILSDLNEAAEEVRLHNQGKLKLKTAQELLNEL